MKSFTTKKISWLQKNPNIIGEGVEAKTIVEVEKKTRKKLDKKGGIGCPNCPK